ILSEILQAGPKTATVCRAHQTVLERLGPELPVLLNHAPELIATSGVALLAEAVGRMREKRFTIRPGFDGEYGAIEIFSDRERAQLRGQKTLFAVAEAPAKTGRRPSPPRREPPLRSGDPPGEPPIRPMAAGDGHRPIPADFLGGLNEDQLRAVMHAQGPLMIVAGPGTGKTHTLTCRIAYRVSQETVDPAGVLALTFTHKAADELRSRLSVLLGKTHALPLAVTFHGLCLSLLQNAAPEKPIAIADETMQAELVAEAISMAGRGLDLPARELQRRIMLAKQKLLNPEDLVQTPGEDPAAADLADVYRAYQHLLQLQGLYDFEELIFQVVCRLERDPDFRNDCRQRFRAVFVDEYQDVNHGQYRIIRALVPPEAETRNLCVIGDPDQSIYGFRGSDPSYFLNFKTDYPDATLISLNRNYRSSNTILTAAFHVIGAEETGRRRTYSSIDGVRSVTLFELPNETAEAHAIARTVESLVGGTGFHSVDTGRVQHPPISAAMSYADFAVLFRTVDQIRWVEEVFAKQGIPCQAVSRRHSLETPRVALLLSLARLVYGAGTYADVAAGAHVLAPPLNRKIVALFKRWCLTNRMGVREGLTRAARFPIPGLRRRQQIRLIEFARALDALSKETGSMKTVAEQMRHISRIPALADGFDPHDSRETLERVLGLAADAGDGPALFLAQMALHVDTDSYHPRAEKVALMTMHAAKGLEFPVVFIAGCEEGLIPFHRRAKEETAGDVAEERRLFYVAMTRAKERLYLTWSRQRKVYGRCEARRVSAFVGDIEQSLIKNETHRESRKKKKPDQLQLF
ncbi:MAG: UvrD-helicase domain-containing protein, partial [Desulfobacteraceae bacterium]|nr:UvrD-helicase domain-containing protein [Desulfobacteraceae bacterium]